MVGFSGMWTKLIAKLGGWAETLVVMLPNILAAMITVAITVWVSRWIEKGVRVVIARMTGNQPISNLLASVARVGMILVSLFVSLGILNLDKAVTSLLAGVGVVGLALGFAFQDIAANFMSGFIMAARRPFDVGDLVEVNGRLGRVRAIELRATELETLDGLAVIIPNKLVFQNPIVNYTKTPTRRLELTIGTAYADDLERVRAVVIAAVSGIPNRDPQREIEVLFSGFGDSSINFALRVWLTASDQLAWLEARSEAMIAIKKAFDREGITIPFPIRTLDFGAKAVGGQPLESMILRTTATNDSVARS